MSGKKGMKKYPEGIRKEVVARIGAGESQCAYIHFYNHERIQLKTGEAPLTRRLSA
ncbi:MAG TPA: hypothetical protein H9668_02080 [Firmicutes bacterium]|nr:hypothetical protein [Bacillota bacterium]